MTTTLSNQIESRRDGRLRVAQSVSPRSACAQRAVPKGRLRVAQDVSPGSACAQRAVPQGRLRVAQDVSPGSACAQRAVPQGRLKMPQDGILGASTSEMDLLGHRSQKRRSRCANHRDLAVLRHDLQGITLQRTHLDHLPQVLFQQIQVQEAHVNAGEVEAARDRPNGSTWRWQRPVRDATGARSPCTARRLSWPRQRPLPVPYRGSAAASRDTP